MLESGIFTLAFGFLQPAMLGWLLAALIPIVIHLWHRHRYHDLDWAATEFVLAALRTERRRILLRQYLLLILRILTIVLIVFAAARPTFQKPTVAGSFRETTGWLFVIDDSLSMHYARDGEPLFDRAIKRIESLVQSAGNGDAFLLLRSASPVRWVIREPIYSKSAFLAELDQVVCRDTIADWSTTLQFLEQRLKELPLEEPRLSRFAVVIATDGQRTNWQPLREAGHSSNRPQVKTTGNLFSTPLHLAELAEVIILNLEVDQPENTGIVELSAYPASVVIGQEVALTGVVKSYGEATRPARLEWLVDGRKVADQSLVWTESIEASFRWAYQFDKAGDHVVTVQLPADSLPSDDQRHVVVNVKQERSILCVDGRFSPLPFQGATSYLKTALASYGLATGHPRQRIDVIPEGRLAEITLNQYEAIFLCDVSRITLGEARGLRQFVKAGGGLVLFLGPRVNRQAYNESLGALTRDGVDLLPGLLKEPVSITESAIDPLNFRHPIVQVFQGRWAPSLLTVPIRTYLPLQLSEANGVDVALRFTNGDPLIATKAVGLGRVVVVTTSADLIWTSLPLWTSYVPLILEIQDYVTSGHSEARTVVAGQSIGQVFPSGSSIGTEKAIITTPQGKQMEHSLNLVGQQLRWSFADTEYSGVYRAEIRSSADSSVVSLFAANPPPDESDITPWNFPAFVETAFPKARCVSAAELSGIFSSDFRSVPRGSPLSRWLLFCVIVLFLGELYLGRQTPGT
ncbi:MAG: BatA domain-containing protein [Thermogutta sp.]